MKTLSIKTLLALLALYEENPPMTVGLPVTTGVPSIKTYDIAAMFILHFWTI